VARLVNGVAEAAPRGAGASAYSQALGIAKRLESLARRFVASEAAGALRWEWALPARQGEEGRVPAGEQDGTGC
jgi:hypothetical protein